MSERKVSASRLRKGGEINITSPTRRSKYIVSIRYNEVYQRFEIFRHYYATGRNEVEYHSKKLEDIVDYIKSMYGVEYEMED